MSISSPVKKMKSNILPPIPFLAAVVALVILPVSPLAASFVATVTGVLSVLILDYGRFIEPLDLSAEIIPFYPPGRAPAESSEAA
jgi:hypothetical protein